MAGVMSDNARAYQFTADLHLPFDFISQHIQSHQMSVGGGWSKQTYDSGIEVNLNIKKGKIGELLALV